MTTHLTATADSHLVQFNGREWTGSGIAVVARLNFALTFIPVTHLSLVQIATACAANARVHLHIMTPSPEASSDPTWTDLGPDIVP